MTATEFIQQMYGELPRFFGSEEDLRRIWSDPTTRKMLLEQLKDAGYNDEVLQSLQQVTDAEKSDLFDVLEYVAFNISPITRAERVAGAHPSIHAGVSREQKEFLDFVLMKYIESGVGELDQEKLPLLLLLKYKSIPDATEKLGAVSQIRSTFMNFQQWLYA